MFVITVPPHIDTKSFSPSIKVKNGSPISVEVKYFGGEPPYKSEWTLNDKVPLFIKLNSKNIQLHTMYLN